MTSLTWAAASPSRTARTTNSSSSGGRQSSRDLPSVGGERRKRAAQMCRRRCRRRQSRACATLKWRCCSRGTSRGAPTNCWKAYQMNRFTLEFRLRGRQSTFRATRLTSPLRRSHLGHHGRSRRHCRTRPQRCPLRLAILPTSITRPATSTLSLAMSTLSLATSTLSLATSSRALTCLLMRHRSGRRSRRARTPVQLCRSSVQGQFRRPQPQVCRARSSFRSVFTPARRRARTSCPRWRPLYFTRRHSTESA